MKLGTLGPNSCATGSPEFRRRPALTHLPIAPPGLKQTPDPASPQSGTWRDDTNPHNNEALDSGLAAASNQGDTHFYRGALHTHTHTRLVRCQGRAAKLVHVAPNCKVEGIPYLRRAHAPYKHMIKETPPCRTCVTTNSKLTDPQQKKRRTCRCRVFWRCVVDLPRGRLRQTL